MCVRLVDRIPCVSDEEARFFEPHRGDHLVLRCLGADRSYGSSRVKSNLDLELLLKAFCLGAQGPPGVKFT